MSDLSTETQTRLLSLIDAVSSLYGVSYKEVMGLVEYNVAIGHSVLKNNGSPDEVIMLGYTVTEDFRKEVSVVTTTLATLLADLDNIMDALTSQNRIVSVNNGQVVVLEEHRSDNKP